MSGLNLHTQRRTKTCTHYTHREKTWGSDLNLQHRGLNLHTQIKFEVQVSTYYTERKLGDQAKPTTWGSGLNLKHTEKTWGSSLNLNTQRKLGDQASTYTEKNGGRASIYNT